jgi:hypothetical protein
MIYKTRYGDEYDLSTWPAEHLAFTHRVYWMYWQNPKYEHHANFILGTQSPVLNRKTNRPRPTRTPLCHGYGVYGSNLSRFLADAGVYYAGVIKGRAE